MEDIRSVSSNILSHRMWCVVAVQVLEEPWRKDNARAGSAQLHSFLDKRVPTHVFGPGGRWEASPEKIHRSVDHNGAETPRSRISAQGGVEYETSEIHLAQVISILNRLKEKW